MTVSGRLLKHVRVIELAQLLLEAEAEATPNGYGVGDQPRGCLALDESASLFGP